MFLKSNEIQHCKFYLLVLLQHQILLKITCESELRNCALVGITALKNKHTGVISTSAQFEGPTRKLFFYLF